ncbi:neuroserpin [Folsomia candida]|uniref:neuroserpin n=1 Tax=Folsomia candida TaxID=158441 RepID=UPI000B903417|nr:neuroserpin [Folsomia candida]
MHNFKTRTAILIGIVFSVAQIYGHQAEDTAVEIERSPELSKISSAQLKFSNRLYRILRDLDEKNLAYSPLIFHLALAALKGAADGDTLNEINIAANIAKFNNTILQDGYHDLIDFLKTDENTTIKLINRIFTSSLFKIDGNFARTLREKFNTHINPLDFSTNTTLAAAKINSFISNYTNGTIKNFVSEDSLEVTNKVVVLNSLYFKAEWEREFMPLLTEKHPFITDDGTEIELDMMNRAGYYPCAEILELNSTALSIPYKGGRFSLTIILPERGIPISQLEKNLEAFPMHAVLSKMSQRYIQLSLPKFTLESNIDMIGPLQLLGVKTLLSPHANLTKMSKKHGLFVNSFIQRTFLSVNEGGTEVSASNFIEAVPVTPRFLVPFTVDRPFVMFVYDSLTSTTLFVGKKLN